jgi:phosphoribosyl-ATP pyrophosphohydrolase/phosphoribosyl-AMP cyclohydrolase
MILPSIDLMNGKAVQLRQGRKKILEKDHPVELARDFCRYGEIAVIDLDAAFNARQNEKIIGEICAVGECRVGGGIRSLDKAKRILALGAEKIIIGTMALKNGQINREFLNRLAAFAGKKRVIIALDSYEGEIVTKGWQERSGLSCGSVIKQMEPYASEFLLTRVDKEGVMKGTDLDFFKSLRDKTEIPLTAAGGISTLEEVVFLSNLGINVQLGMALYKEKILLNEAFIASLKWESDLIPTVTVDPSQQVLMLAYSSRESLRRTFKTGKVWYFSRSRHSLWMKGETSANVQNFLRIRSDCDGDALLITAQQQGDACHTRRYSCFGSRIFSLTQLYDVIQDRLENPTPSSYSARLDKKMLKEKIREEAEELIEAEKKEDIVWEASDLLYFFMVLLVKSKIPFSEVVSELGRRRRKSKISELKHRDESDEKAHD